MTTVPLVDEHTEADIAAAADCDACQLLHPHATPNPAAYIAVVLGHPYPGIRFICHDHAEACRRLNRNPICAACGRTFRIDLEAIGGGK